MPTYSYRRSFRLWRLLAHGDREHPDSFAGLNSLWHDWAWSLPLASNNLDLTYGDIFAFGTFTAADATCFWSQHKVPHTAKSLI